MIFILAPLSDRATLRFVLGRLDQILGYPRTHRKVQGKRTPRTRTETAFAVLQHDNTGPALLHGVLAVFIDNDTQTLLSGRYVEYNSVRKTFNQWIIDLGWETRQTLPDMPTTIYESSPWTQLSPRDSGQGSVDGTPISEGQE